MGRETVKAGAGKTTKAAGAISAEYIVTNYTTGGIAKIKAV